MGLKYLAHSLGSGFASAGACEAPQRRSEKAVAPERKISGLIIMSEPGGEYG